MSKKKLFCICLLGGLAFGVLFFIFFGIEAGYGWVLAVGSLIGGLAFAVLFFLAMLVAQKFSKPVSFEDKKAQARLQENESTFYGNFRKKFSAFLPYGKGLKQAVCETAVYLFPDKLRIVFCHFKKLYTADFAYRDIIKVVTEGQFIEIHSIGDEGCSAFFELKEEETRFAEMLTDLGVRVEDSRSEVSAKNVS